MARKASNPAVAVSPDMEALFAQFVQFATQAGITEDSPIGGEQLKAVNAKRTPTRSSSNTPRGTKAATLNAARTRTTTKPTTRTAKGAITCGDAWKALGGDPQYTPSNPSAPARNAQLWALNAAGKLRFA